MNNRNYFPTLYFPSALTSNLKSIQTLDWEKFFIYHVPSLEKNSSI